ncbi:MAG TPA: Wzy polymerase domain-containing protein [Burkholderiales bacterium]|nr:Wzy polymerase domain-containing protein [Burkholderiales bacterium]
MVLGLAAFACLLSRSMWVGMQLPRSALMFLGFAGLILLHALVGRSTYLQQNLMAILYLLWASALAMLAWRLRQVFGMETVVAVLSGFVVAGTLLNAIIGLIQIWGVQSPFSPYVLPQTYGRIYANTGQPNHLANYLCLGLASLAYLYGVRRLALPLALAAAAPLLLVLTVSGSRSIWIYLAALVILGVVLYRLRPQPVALRILGFGIACVYGFLAMQWLAEFLLANAALPIETLQARMGQHGLQSGFRMRVWDEAWRMFLDAPLIGAGFRQFSWLHFLLNAQLPGPRIVDAITDHAHNLVLQTMAEFGIAGIAVLGAGLSSLVLAIRRREPSAYLWWLCAVLAILGVHSMLEYPLWYAYFLGIAAVSLGVSETVVVTVSDRGRGRLVLVPMLILGCMAAANVYQDYRTLQSLHQIQPQPSGGAAQSGESTAAVLLEMQKYSLFAPFVELALSRLMVLNREQIDDKLSLNGLVMRFAPSADVVYRHAILLALKGEQEAAKTQWNLAEANYPLERGGAIQVMESMAAGGENDVAELIHYTMTGSAKELR